MKISSLFSFLAGFSAHTKQIAIMTTQANNHTQGDVPGEPCNKQGSSRPHFVLGYCSVQSSEVLFEAFESPDDEPTATTRFRDIESGKQSAVLFHKHSQSEQNNDAAIDSPYIPHLMSSQHASDVAVILQACHQEFCQEDTIRRTKDKLVRTVVDRLEIEQQILSGDAPMVPPSRHRVHQWFIKQSTEMLFYRPVVEYFAAGPHRLASLCYYDVKQYPQVKGYVALTLDDAPSRFGPRNSRLDEIRELLNEYNVKATFMLVGKFIPGHEEQLVRLLQEGHEFANHGQTDRALYDKSLPEVSDETFLAAVDDCTHRIQALQQKAIQATKATNDDSTASMIPTIQQGVRYFRAPHGKYTRRMEELLESRNLMNVMCDAYASDPIVEDGDFIAKSLTRQARDGGIILLHIPERGFREHCMVALRGLLEGLKNRQLQAVTLGTLEALAKSIPK